MQYQPVIGLEIHVQAKTASKMFCRCQADYFNAPANSFTCPVCLGLPGALPVPNAAALEQCFRLAVALNCKLNLHTKFDRKHYFYADLPKGYQISQYDQPVGYQGYLEFDIAGDSRRVRITRVHMEEDTAKSLHTEAGTLIDFNKSGVPLIEIVTEPDFADVEEVGKFAKRLKQTVQYLGVSDADMEKGQMRFELNISVRKAGTKDLPNYKVEVKNISSISVLEKVITFEIERQSKLLEAGEELKSETRGLKDMSGETLSQRTKETAADYRYFPEPDIPLLDFDEAFVERIKASIPKLPNELKLDYINNYGLEPDSAETIVHAKWRVEWVNELIKLVVSNSTDQATQRKYIKEAVKWFIGDVFGLKQLHSVEFSNLPVTQQDLFDLVRLLDEKAISGTIAKQVLEILFTEGGRVMEIIEKQGLRQVSNADELQDLALQVINENPKVVTDSLKNPNAIKFLVGQLMKLSRGKANPHVAEELLKDLINKSSN